MAQKKRAGATDNLNNKQKVRKKKGFAGVLQWVLLAVAAGVFIYALVAIVDILKTYGEAENEYNALGDYGAPTEGGSDWLPGVLGGDSPGGVVVDGEPFEIDFEELAAINPDIVAWITVIGTNINYPVVQGDDNDYYLNRTFEKRSNGAGCLFLDYSNDGYFGDKNSIIYGHNMNNKTMFNNLTLFKRKDFFEKHGGKVMIYTPDKTYRLQICTVFITNDWLFNIPHFSNERDFEDYLSAARSRRLYDTGVEVTAGDRIVTLSTCTYEYNDARFVVQAKFVEEE